MKRTKEQMIYSLLLDYASKNSKSKFLEEDCTNLKKFYESKSIEEITTQYNNMKYLNNVHIEPECIMFDFNNKAYALD